MEERKTEQSCLNRNTVDCIAGLCRRSIKNLTYSFFKHLCADLHGSYVYVYEQIHKP